MPSTTAALKVANQPLKPTQNEEIKPPSAPVTPALPAPAAEAVIDVAKETAKSFLSEIVTKFEEKAEKTAEVVKAKVEEEIAPIVKKVEDLKEKLKHVAKAEEPKVAEMTARDELQARVEAEKRRRWLLGFGRG